MVRKVGGIHIPRSVSGQIGDKIFEDDSYVRYDEPPGEADLLALFRKWVKNTPEGTFQEILKGWVKGRVDLELSVNPGPLDPNEKPKKKPTKAFQTALEGVFNEVRAGQAKSRKRKK